MALYFFNLHECGHVTADPEGIPHKTINAVRDEALRSAREIMCAELIEGRLCLSCSIEVVDRTGALVIAVPFRDAVTVTGL